MGSLQKGGGGCLELKGPIPEGGGPHMDEYLPPEEGNMVILYRLNA